MNDLPFVSPHVHPNTRGMANLLPPIRVAGVRYRVLHLDGDRGPRYLLRSQVGDLVGPPRTPLNRGDSTLRRWSPHAGPQTPLLGSTSSTWTVRWWLTMLSRVLARFGRALDLARS
jgi:hypothetical protein